MDECEKIISKYFNDDTCLNYINKSRAIKSLKILKKIEQHGDEMIGPDLVSETKKRIYGIEQFEIDSTKNSRKGTRFRKNISNIDNIMNKRIINENYVHNISILPLDSSIDNYIENYKKNYIYHCSRIPSYFLTLEKKFPEISKEIWFFIEDVTPFGNYYLDRNNDLKLFNPMLSEELIELFEKNTQVKCIIFATNTLEKEKRLFLFFNDKKEIELLKNICKRESVKKIIVQNVLCSTTFTKTNNLK